MGSKNPRQMTTDESEHIHLIRPEDAALGASIYTSVAMKPQFQKCSDINQAHVDLLESAAAAANQPEEVLKDPKILDALLVTLKNLKTSHQAALYISKFLVDGCQRDTSNWKIVAEGVSYPGTDAAFDCFKVNWQNAEVNDNVGFLVSNLINYAVGGQDLRPLFKMIIDPSQVPDMSVTGRLACICNLLRVDSLRYDLAGSSTLRGAITAGLKSTSSQDVYYSVLGLWQLSFSNKVMEEKGPLYIHRSMFRSFLSMLSTFSKKEKITRASVKLISQMIDYEWCFEILVQQKVDTLLTTLTYENWKDPTLNDDINNLLHKFYFKQNQMNNFDRYLRELEAQQFLPGSLHSEKFWVQNVNRFEDNEYEIVKKLAKLLVTSSDPTTLSLACFDVGEFARLYPTGKQVVTNIGAKAQIMDLMNHSNKDVARQALLTTQKLMLDNWKQLGSQDPTKNPANTTTGNTVAAR